MSQDDRNSGIWFAYNKRLMYDVPLHTAAAPARHRRCTLRCRNFILPTSSPPLPPAHALSSFRAIRVTYLCISLRNTVVQPLHAVVEIAPPPLIVQIPK
ncbi:unnamed protein product [Citrullus colocynthis]|uniref:Uncharacterized protein n=1 Tax=Citrullus colocynthis TaxID=252529 RepID=A0ABP0YIV5_9ROSI